MREVSGVYRTVGRALSVPTPPSWYQVSAMVTEVARKQGTGRGVSSVPLRGFITATLWYLTPHCDEVSQELSHGEENHLVGRERIILEDLLGHPPPT